MLKQRVITALVLVAVLFGALAWSPLAFAMLMAAAVALAQAEWLQLAGWKFSSAWVSPWRWVAVLVTVLVMQPEAIHAVTFALAALAHRRLGWCSASCCCAPNGAVPCQDPIGALDAVRSPASCGRLVLGDPFPARRNCDCLISVLFIVWLADTAAYFAGRAFGKTKLAPHISPGKTWAGVWGAMLAVSILALLIWKALPAAPLYTIALLDRLGIAVALPLFAALVALSIVGDLFESLLKRQAGVKDSGHLLPGHGGFYDRLDAMLALLPAAALFWNWAK